MLRRMLLAGGGLMFALILGSSPALAQITTGNVSGTVKDAQGGVIPGATVVLISETRGTKSAPAVTNETGDYVFPNVTPDTYTVEVTMEAFKTVKRGGITVSGGDRVGDSGDSRSKPGALGRNRHRHRRSRRSCSRRAASGRSRSRPRRSRTCRSPRSNFTSLTAFTPGVVPSGASAGGTRLGGAGQNNIMMDGISAMDTGNNGQMLNMNVDVDRRGEDPDAGLPGRVRPVERPADHRRHQERHNRFRGSAYDLQTNSDWNANSWVNEQERRPEAEDQHQDARLHDRRSGRQAGRQQQAVLLLLARVSSDDRRRSTAATRSASACRPRSSAPATSRRRVDNNGALFNLIKDPTLDAAVHARPTRPAASRTAASSAGFRRTGSIATGLGAPQPLPAAERHAGAGPELQLRGRRRRRSTT